MPAAGLAIGMKATVFASLPVGFELDAALCSSDRGNDHVVPAVHVECWLLDFRSVNTGWPTIVTIRRRTHTHRVRIHLDFSAVATREQRNCRSSGKVLNLKILLDWSSGAISPMAKCWTTNAGLARSGQGLAVSQVSVKALPPAGTPERLCPHSPVLKARRLANDEFVAMLASPMQ
jgi:hypothetical protein